jgi:hypothetical protein
LKSPAIGSAVRAMPPVRTAFVEPPLLNRRSAELLAPLTSRPERLNSRCVNVVPPSFSAAS